MKFPNSFPASMENVRSVRLSPSLSVTLSATTVEPVREGPVRGSRQRDEEPYLPLSLPRAGLSDSLCQTRDGCH